jgi:hypothetical protein
MYGRFLLTEWDPIDIRNEPNAQDEYDEYVPQIVDMLTRNARVDEIVITFRAFKPGCMCGAKRCGIGASLKG